MGDSSQKVGDMGTVLNKQIKGNRLRDGSQKVNQGQQVEGTVLKK